MQETAATDRPDKRRPKVRDIASLQDLYHRLVESGEGEEVQVGEILDSFGGRALGPLLFVPSVIACAPVIGALPGVSWTMAALVLFFAGQHLFDPRSPAAIWLPQRMRRASLSRRALRKSEPYILPVLKVVDRFTRRRLTFLVGDIGTYVIAAVCVLLGIGMYVLSLIPGGVVIPAAAVVVFAIALTAKDGLIAVLGYAAGGGALTAVWVWGPKLAKAAARLFGSG